MEIELKRTSRTLRKATTERLSTSSDRVFAVLTRGTNFAGTPPALPIWLSYAVSYLFIAIVWANHHHLPRYATEVTPRLMWFNFGHLFSVSLLPLATAWMAVSELASQPVAFYAAVFWFVNFTYILLIWELIEETSDNHKARRISNIMRVRSIITLCVFSCAIVIALKYPPVGLGLCCTCLIVYLKPEAPWAGV